MNKKRSVIKDRLAYWLSVLFDSSILAVPVFLGVAWAATGSLLAALGWSSLALLFADGVHLKYFDTAEEFFELADWYLAHEDERIKIANAGMERAHTELNGTKIAKYTLDVIENGDYTAPWR